jgi:hypothetical protein
MYSYHRATSSIKHQTAAYEQQPSAIINGHDQPYYTYIFY